MRIIEVDDLKSLFTIHSDPTPNQIFTVDVEELNLEVTVRTMIDGLSYISIRAGGKVIVPLHPFEIMINYLYPYNLCKKYAFFLLPLENIRYNINYSNLNKEVTFAYGII